MKLLKKGISSEELNSKYDYSEITNMDNLCRKIMKKLEFIIFAIKSFGAGMGLALVILGFLSIISNIEFTELFVLNTVILSGLMISLFSIVQAIIKTGTKNE